MMIMTGFSLVLWREKRWSAVSVRYGWIMVLAFMGFGRWGKDWEPLMNIIEGIRMCYDLGSSGMGIPGLGLELKLELMLFFPFRGIGMG